MRREDKSQRRKFLQEVEFPLLDKGAADRYPAMLPERFVLSVPSPPCSPVHTSTRHGGTRCGSTEVPWNTLLSIFQTLRLRAWICWRSGHGAVDFMGWSFL